MHVHGVAEAVDNALGAEAAGLILVRIASLREQHLLVVNGHAAAAHPIVAVTRVNMIEIGQRGSPSSGMISPEYQIAWEEHRRQPTALIDAELMPTLEQQLRAWYSCQSRKVDQASKQQGHGVRS